jgi:hypothetical protein
MPRCSTALYINYVMLQEDGAKNIQLKMVEGLARSMVIVTFLGLLTSSPALGNLNNFLLDVRDQFRVVKSALVTNDCNDFTGATNYVPNSYMCYSNKHEAQEVVQYIKWMKKLDQLDVIFFIGKDHGTLLGLLNQDNKLFCSSIMCVVSGYPTVKLELRLDTRLFYYHGHDSLFKLFELYAIKGGSSITRQIGSWTPNRGLIVTNPNIWERRANLMGTKLICTTLPFSILTIVQYDDSGNVATVTGLFKDVLNRLEETLNFTAQTVMSQDGQWGALVNESWNGMVGMLINGETDIVIAALSHTVDRAKVISYAIPLQSDMNTLIAPREKGQATQFWVYMDIFPNETWFVLACMMMATCLGFFVINKTGVNRFHKSYESEKFGIENSLALSILMLWQLSYDVVIDKISAKVLFFIAGMTTHVVYAYYTSDLTARMTSGPPSNSIRSFNDVIEKDYKVIVHESTSNHVFLKSANPNSAMFKFYWSQMDGNSDSFVNSAEEAVGRVLTEEKTLFFTSMFSAFGDERIVTLKMIDSISSNNGWAFQKDSELVDFFNHHLFKMQQSGVQYRVNRDWKYRANEDFGFPEAISLGYGNAAYPFLLLMGGVCSAICLLSVEKCRLQYEYFMMKIPSWNMSGKRVN